MIASDFLLLDNEEKALKYGEGRVPTLLGWSPSRAEKLSGGNINFVYRLSSSAGKDTCILKMYPPFIAMSPEVPFSQERFLTEVGSLNLIGLHQHELSKSMVCVPKVYLADLENFCLIVEDIGENAVSLTEALQPESSISTSQLESVAAALGKFLKSIFGLANCAEGSFLPKSPSPQIADYLKSCWEEILEKYPDVQILDPGATNHTFIVRSLGLISETFGPIQSTSTVRVGQSGSLTLKWQRLEKLMTILVS